MGRGLTALVTSNRSNLLSDIRKAADSDFLLVKAPLMAAASSLKLTKYPKEKMIQRAGAEEVCHFHFSYL